MGALARDDGAAVLSTAAEIAHNTGMILAAEGDHAGWNGFNVLHTAAARTAGLDLGFVPGSEGRDINNIIEGAQAGEIEIVYLLSADELNANDLCDAFVIYQGSHGDRGAHRADVILPGAASTEKYATWVNTEGRAQLGNRAAHPPGDARDDWAIIRALSEVLGHKLDYNNLDQLREVMRARTPVLGFIDSAPGASDVAAFDHQQIGKPGPLSDTPFELPIKDFYLTNPITRASKIMAECSDLYWMRQSEGKSAKVG
jgi:NADH-quinone oxidoreductase subunit G